MPPLTRPSSYTFCTYTHYTYCLIPASSTKSYITSISAGLEIEALIKIGVEVCLHARGKERLVLGAWNDHVACTG